MRKFLMIISCLIVIFGFSMKVYAKDITMSTNGSNIYFNYSNKGKDNAKLNIATSSTACNDDCKTTWKYVGNKDSQANWLYCTQFHAELYGPPYTYTSNDNLDPFDARALKAGLAIEKVNEKYSKDNEKYLYGSLLLNRIFGFSKNNGKYAKATYSVALDNIFNIAKEQYKVNKENGCYGSKIVESGSPIVINAATTTLNLKTSSGNTQEYVSSAVSLAGYRDKQCDVNLTWKAYVTADGNNVKTYICSNSAGTSCNEVSSASPKTINGSAFFIKISGTNLSNITLTVKGSSATAKFPSVSEYYSTKEAKSVKNDIKAGKSGNKYQILIRKRTASTSYSLSKSQIFTIPDNNLTVYKVDESGENLGGAELTFYKSSFDTATNKCTNNKIGGNINLTVGTNGFSWKSNGLTLENNVCYCVHETKAPSGYVLTGDTCSKYSAVENSTTCWKTTDGNVTEETNANECGATWKNCDNDQAPVSDGNGGKTCPKDPLVSFGSCNVGMIVADGEHSGMCVIFSDQEEDETTHEMTCGTKEEISVSGETKCATYETPTCDTANGYSWNGSSRMCEKIQSDPAVCLGGDGQPLNSTDPCVNSNNYAKVEIVGGSMSITKYNYQTSVSISKTDITGEEEIPGAVLRICDTKPDAKGNCTPVQLVQKGYTCPSSSETTVDDNNSSTSDAETSAFGCTYNAQTNTRTIDLIWTSDGFPRNWTGLEIGKTYYIVEDTPPTGYVTVTTYVEFVIQENGNVKSGSKELVYDKDVLIINNQLSKVNFSKLNASTSKEIPGATMVIYEASIDDNGKWSMVKDINGGNAIAVKEDGEYATWVSTNQPYVLEGLPVGNYYLVEFVAPKGYSTAEMIPFSLNKDGTLTDKNGKSLKDSKIVMYDKPITDVKTGSLSRYIIMFVLTFAVVGSAGSYYFLKRENANTI